MKKLPLKCMYVDTYKLFKLFSWVLMVKVREIDNSITCKAKVEIILKLANRIIDVFAVMNCILRFILDYSCNVQIYFLPLIIRNFKLWFILSAMMSCLLWTPSLYLTFSWIILAFLMTIGLIFVDLGVRKRFIKCDIRWQTQPNCLYQLVQHKLLVVVVTIS